jgi:hypothetical protein
MPTALSDAVLLLRASTALESPQLANQIVDPRISASTDVVPQNTALICTEGKHQVYMASILL